MVQKIKPAGRGEAEIRRAFMAANDRFARVSVVDLPCVIDDYTGAAITTGHKWDFPFRYAGRLVEISLLADQTGSIQIDVWKDLLENYPPTDADSLCGGNELTIVNATQNLITDLSGWLTTQFAKGQTMRLNVDSCTAIERCMVHFKVEVS